MSEVAINNLPEGWELAQLKDVCSKITDGTHKTPKYKDKGVRFISIKNIKPYQPVNWDSYEKYISQEEHEELIKRCKPEYDDILFPRIGTLGYAKRIDFNEEVSIFVGLGLLKPVKEVVYPKYLEYWMNHPLIYRLSHERATGSGRLTLALAESKKLPIPLAPYEQQKRIVAKIEELFSHIDAGIEALKKAKQLLKQYRQSVLKAAVTGELLGEQFPADMYKSVEHGLESLGQGWSPKCEKEPSPSEDVWGVIKTTAVQSLEYLQEENKRLPDKLEPRPHLEVKSGDILVTRAGPRVRVGVCCLVKESRKKLMICDKVYRLRSNTSEILPEFLEIVLNAPQVQDEIGELKTGISDSGVNLTQKRFVELKIPYPDIKDQQKIVDLVYEKADAISRLENEIDFQLGKAEKNKQSVLFSAFSGKV